MEIQRRLPAHRAILRKRAINQRRAPKSQGGRLRPKIFPVHFLAGPRRGEVQIFQQKQLEPINKQEDLRTAGAELK